MTIELYRIGYYGGKGGRFMQRLGPFQVHTQPTPPIAEHRLRSCNWERSTSFAIPRDWISGVYVGKLSCAAHRYQSYIIFIVRDDRKADILFQTSDTTWQAYNKWPDEYSLYDSDSPQQPHSGRTWVSFDRPYGKYPQVVDQSLSQGSGEFLLWEYPLCYWLEQ
ncbi:MAG: N,N-dimethylformamidase beta subunit family domain-containing protein, partial [Dyadobacter sp.]